MALSQAPSGADPRSLHELAVDVVTDIHKLATGLAHAGVQPRITQQIEGTSELFSQIAKGLASGPVGQQGGASPPQAGPPPAPQAPPPNPGAPVPGGPGAPQVQAPARGGLHNAIADMHRTSVNAVARAG